MQKLTLKKREQLLRIVEDIFAAVEGAGLIHHLDARLYNFIYYARSGGKFLICEADRLGLLLVADRTLSFEAVMLSLSAT